MSIAKSTGERLLKIVTAIGGLGVGLVLAYVLEDLHRAARLWGWIR